jgi:quercetin dioxygenase-like cupin family protein
MEHYVLKKMEPARAGEGVDRWVMHGDRMTMAYFRLQSGAGIPKHSHPHEQMGMVLKGAIELVVGDEKIRVDAGEWYRIPSHVEHGGTCKESPAEILEVFSPPREDLR